MKKQTAKIKTKRCTRDLACKLTDTELINYGHDLSGMLLKAVKIEIEAKDKAKAYKDQITAIEVESGVKVRALDTGEETRSVDCRWEYDFTHNTKTLRRLDTWEVIETKAIEEHERQMSFEVVEEDVIVPDTVSRFEGGGLNGEGQREAF
jgi:hypothetical protein